MLSRYPECAMYVDKQKKMSLKLLFIQIKNISYIFEEILLRGTRNFGKIIYTTLSKNNDTLTVSRDERRGQ